jgi:hypothetical protein
MTAVLLTAIACARIVATYPVFSQTFDEAAKTACGMRLLMTGRFPREIHHPPLALVAISLGLFLKGVPLIERGGDVYREGNDLYYHSGQYLKHLTLSRVGVLPFVILLAGCVWIWARRKYGTGAGILALLLLTTLPEVLAHGGIASNDLPIAATLTGALFFLVRWLEEPGMNSSLHLGLWSGLAVACKSSAPLFLIAALIAFALWRRVIRRRDDEKRPGLRQRFALASIALLVSLTVLWASYFFRLDPLTDSAHRPHVLLDRVVGERGALHDLTYFAAEDVPVPLTEFLYGSLQLVHHNGDGHPAFLLGQYSRMGWWYYFPVAFAVKTPLPFLLITLVAVPWMLVSAALRREWSEAAPALAAIAVMASSIPSGLNIGVRHILPIYPLLSIAGGSLLARRWNSGRAVVKAAVAALVGWQIFATALAHPDYLAYFNELAPRPSQVLVDSNLDWGQDLFRLERELRRRQIPSVWIAYFGTADLSRHNLPEWKTLEPRRPVRGWVAISETAFSGVYGVPDDYAWLKRYRPVGMVGKSIRLYLIR